MIYVTSFKCKKCGHIAYKEFNSKDTVKDVIGFLKDMGDMSCPKCGQEAYDNWILDAVLSTGWNKSYESDW